MSTTSKSVEDILREEHWREEELVNNYQRGIATLPAHAVSAAIFRIDRDQAHPPLRVLLMQPKWAQPFNDWMLPETELAMGEEIYQSAQRLVTELTGASSSVATVETLPRGKQLPGVVTVCLAGVGRRKDAVWQKDSRSSWADVTKLPPELIGNYPNAIALAIQALAASPRDVANLIANEDFTIGELREGMNEVRKIAGIDGELDVRNFRRRVEEADWLIDTGRMSSGNAFRPAKLYRVAQLER